MPRNTHTHTHTHTHTPHHFTSRCKTRMEIIQSMLSKADSLHPKLEESESVSCLLCCAVLCLVVQSYLALCDPTDVAHQAPLSMDFSRQEYRSGQAFPSPGDLPNPEIEPLSPAFQANSLPSEQVYAFILFNPMDEMGLPWWLRW